MFCSDVSDVPLAAGISSFVLQGNAFFKSNRHMATRRRIVAWFDLLLEFQCQIVIKSQETMDETFLEMVFDTDIFERAVFMRNAIDDQAFLNFLEKQEKFKKMVRA
ncbi:hypothetical protein HDU83_009613 [Entophlyctis luteolus]|nr:hypothetical protein HDU83_009613 [Entophlyctis luteolus]